MAKPKRGSPPEVEASLTGPNYELKSTEVFTIPVPSEEESPAPAAEASKVIPLGVRLEVFLRLAGRKPDQLAGFVAHARLKKLGPMPVASWRAALSDFDRRPTK